MKSFIGFISLNRTSSTSKIQLKEDYIDESELNAMKLKYDDAVRMFRKQKFNTTFIFKIHDKKVKTSNTGPPTQPYMVKYAKKLRPEFIKGGDIIASKIFESEGTPLKNSEIRQFMYLTIHKNEIKYFEEFIAQDKQCQYRAEIMSLKIKNFIQVKFNLIEKKLDDENLESNWLDSVFNQLKDSDGFKNMYEGLILVEKACNLYNLLNSSDLILGNDSLVDITEKNSVFSTEKSEIFMRNVMRSIYKELEDMIQCEKKTKKEKGEMLDMKFILAGAVALGFGEIFLMAYYAGQLFTYSTIIWTLLRDYFIVYFTNSNKKGIQQMQKREDFFEFLECFELWSNNIREKADLLYKVMSKVSDIHLENVRSGRLDPPFGIELMKKLEFALGMDNGFQILDEELNEYSTELVEDKYGFTREVKKDLSTGRTAKIHSSVLEIYMNKKQTKNLGITKTI